MIISWTSVGYETYHVDLSLYELILNQTTFQYESHLMLENFLTDVLVDSGSVNFTFPSSVSTGSLYFIVATMFDSLPSLYMDADIEGPTFTINGRKFWKLLFNFVLFSPFFPVYLKKPNS